jgi:hypothetical protein
MSTIDGYRHQRIGVVSCPSRFALVPGYDHLRQVPIYRLDEDVEGESTLGGKQGDILIGGGRGESAAFRIAIPEAFLFYTHDDYDGIDVINDVHQAYWTMTDAFVFGDGYEKLGWTPPTSIEPWLTQHVLSFLLHHFPEQYKQFLGKDPLTQDGSICQLTSTQNAEQTPS